MTATKGYNKTTEGTESYVRRTCGEIKIASSGNEINVKICPFCQGDTSKAENQWKLYVNRMSGAFNCHRCNAKGSFFDFTRKFGDATDCNNKPKASKKKAFNDPPPITKDYPNQLSSNMRVREYLKSRGLSHETIKKYSVGATNEEFRHEADDDPLKGQTVNHDCVTFPAIMIFEKNGKREEKTVRVKLRPIDFKTFRLKPGGGRSYWFGLQTVPNGAQEICITEGEIDAMSVNQKTGIPAISLPDGAGSLSDDLVTTLDPFKKIFLWMDDDETGREFSTKFAEKLGFDRTYIVKTRQGKNDGPKDANELLMGGGDFMSAVQASAPLDPTTLPDEEVICIDDVKEEDITYLWPPYIAKGKITLIVGDPDSGKTFVTCAISAAVSGGPGLPNANNIEPKRVLICNAEDGVEDTIKKRLKWMGANQRNVLCYNEPVQFDEPGFVKIEEKLRKYQPALIVFDPLQSFLGAKLDMSQANETRPALRRLGDLARKYNCAIVLVCHLNKNSLVDNAVYRILGSIDIPGASRSILLVGKDKSDSNNGAIIHSKSNLTSKGATLGFRISPNPDGTAKFEWTGESKLTQFDLLIGKRTERTSDRLNEAKEFLLAILATGPMNQTEVKKEAEAQNIAETTLRRAMKELGIKSRPIREKGKPGIQGWIWILPIANSDGLGNHEKQSEHDDHLNPTFDHFAPAQDSDAQSSDNCEYRDCEAELVNETSGLNDVNDVNTRPLVN